MREKILREIQLKKGIGAKQVARNLALPQEEVDRIVYDLVADRLVSKHPIGDWLYPNVQSGFATIAAKRTTSPAEELVKAYNNALEEAGTLEKVQQEFNGDAAEAHTALSYEPREAVPLPDGGVQLRSQDGTDDAYLSKEEMLAAQRYKISGTAFHPDADSPVNVEEPEEVKREAITEYLRGKRRVTLIELAEHFNVSQRVFMPHLAAMVREGTVIKHPGVRVCYTLTSEMNAKPSAEQVATHKQKAQAADSTATIDEVAQIRSMILDLLHRSEATFDELLDEIKCPENDLRFVIQQMNKSSQIMKIEDNWVLSVRQSKSPTQRQEELLSKMRPGKSMTLLDLGRLLGVTASSLAPTMNKLVELNKVVKVRQSPAAYMLCDIVKDAIAEVQTSTKGKINPEWIVLLEALGKLHGGNVAASLKEVQDYLQR